MKSLPAVWMWALLYAVTAPTRAAGPVEAPAPPDAASPGPEATAAPFTFLVYGDSRSNDTCNGNAVHLGLINQMSGEAASLAFHTGDMVTGYTNTTNWVQNGACTSPTSYGSFLNQVAPLRNHAPAPGLPMFLYPVVGNHDDAWGDLWYPDPYGNGFCSVFNPQLFVPNHTTKSYFHPNSDNSPVIPDTQFYAKACSVTTPEVYSRYLYYSFDFQNSHFLVLRINTDITDLTGQCNSCAGDFTNYSDYYQIHQLDFVKYDLAQAQANPAIKNIFVLMHAPVFTTCDSHPQSPSWQVLTKEFTKYGVAAVFAGHCHIYERTVPIVVDTAHPTGVQNNQTGTVYVTSGGGGSPVNGYNGPPAWFDAVRSVTNHYVRVTVNGQTTTVNAIDSNGVQIDSFSITSSGCSINADCDDGNACNGAETCAAGTCQAGTSLSCNDGNACTTDSCIPASGCSHTAVSCNDSNACTTDSCVPASGCSYTAVSCNDNDACTADSCVPATGCDHSAISCNDNDACTADSCVPATGCAHSAISCNDSNACTADSCVPATGCAHSAISCNDSDACTADSCVPATGCAHGLISCNDSNACTADSCVPATGCVNTDTTPACNDGNACTADSCVPATGCAHSLISCNDSNACTADSCVPATGCVNTDTTPACNDGNACTADGCDALLGCTHATVSCSDGNACTTDGCVPSTGCTHASISCNDHNLCTNDSCDAGSGCINTDNTPACNDGSACTVDGCAPLLGCTHSATPCNDSDACTADGCDALLGCTHTAIFCDDSSPCTADACDAALGCTHTAVACDDHNPCTTDLCDPGLGGCVGVNNSESCDDGNRCTDSDQCADGACSGSAIPDCVPPPPLEVLNLRLSRSGDDLLLQWDPVPGAAQYRIYSDLSPAGSFAEALVPDFASTSATIPLPAPAMHYKVVAVGPSGVEGPK